MSMLEPERSPQEIERKIQETRRHISETLGAIQERIGPGGELMEGAWEYIRGGGIHTGKVLVRSMRDHPVPIGLIGVGVTWLVISSSGSSGSTSMRAGQRPVQPRHASQYYEGYEAELGYESGGVAGGGNYLGESRNNSNLMRTSNMNISDTSSFSVKERSSEAGHQFGEQASEKMHNLKTSYRQQTNRARRGIQAMVEENPIALVAIGIGLGAFVGAILPTTRREDQLLEEPRSRFREGVMEAGREKLEQARQMAESAARSAREKVEGEKSESGRSEYKRTESTAERF
jgi:ElaB/YqjD/DUF883 family membrane-anchored ribosome-binding protein